MLLSADVYKLLRGSNVPNPIIETQSEDEKAMSHLESSDKSSSIELPELSISY
jgi:hypothetical protein